MLSCNISKLRPSLQRRVRQQVLDASKAAGLGELCSLLSFACGGLPSSRVKTNALKSSSSHRASSSIEVTHTHVPHD